MARVVFDIARRPDDAVTDVFWQETRHFDASMMDVGMVEPGGLSDLQMT